MTTTLKFQSNDQINSSVIINSETIFAILNFISVPNNIKNKKAYIPQLTVFLNNQLIQIHNEFSIFNNKTLKKFFKYKMNQKLIYCDSTNKLDFLFKKYEEDLSEAFLSELLPVLSNIECNNSSFYDFNIIHLKGS